MASHTGHVPEIEEEGMTAQSSTRPRRAICTVIATVLVAMAASLSADTPSASAAGGHSYSHGSLWCSSTQIAVGRGMTASVRRGESVRMRHTVYRWTGQKWVAIFAAAPVRTYPTSVPYVSAEYSSWYTIGTSAHRPPQFPSWNIPLRGYYYAIAEDIRWLNSAGTVVDRHKGWVTTSTGHACRF
jgi:hypothetical protein